ADLEVIQGGLQLLAVQSVADGEISLQGSEAHRIRPFAGNVAAAGRAEDRHGRERLLDEGDVHGAVGYAEAGGAVEVVKKLIDGMAAQGGDRLHIEAPLGEAGTGQSLRHGRDI